LTEGSWRPVRITYLIGSLEIGGAEQQLVRLVNALDRGRFQPSVLCLYRGGALESALDPSIPVDGVSLDSVTHRGVRSKVLLALRILWTVGRGLRRQRPDIVHAYMPTAYVLGAVAAWCLRIRVVIASRRALVSYHMHRFARWRLLARFANRVIDLHLCNSDAVREYAIAREGLDRGRTAVVHNGLDLPRPGAPPPLPDGWRTAGTTLLAVCVANLIHYKNHRMLLRATARVAADHPGFRLVLIGQGPERPALALEAEQMGISGRIVFAGSVPAAAQLLPAFDLALLTSDEEGFPNAVVEAQAAGVPVVATAVGGVLELITDGVDGLLVRAGDDAELAAAIHRLAAAPDLRRRLGAAGRDRIGRQFSVERMVTATEAVYDKLLCMPARAAVPS